MILYCFNIFILPPYELGGHYDLVIVTPRPYHILHILDFTQKVCITLFAHLTYKLICGLVDRCDARCTQSDYLRPPQGPHIWP